MSDTATYCIVGMGLMGGSYAMGLSKKGYRVLGLDNNPASIDWALKNKLIVQGSSDESASVVGQADYIVLCLYPQDIVGWLEKHLLYLKKGALITDLCGVKGCYVDKAQEIAINHEYIACHPMAGKEVSGVQNADDAIFKGANFLITPTPRNTSAGINFAQNLAAELGFGTITQLSLQEHDAMIGYVSQLTHAIAVSLMNANADPRLPEVTGDSFRDLTRIADINGELWSELFLANAAVLTQEIDTFTTSLNSLKEKIISGDKEGLKELFAKSTARRREFGKK